MFWNAYRSAFRAERKVKNSEEWIWRAKHTGFHRKLLGWWNESVLQTMPSTWKVPYTDTCSIKSIDNDTFYVIFFLVGFCFLSYPKYFFSFKRRSDPFTFIIVTAMFGLLLSRLILYLLFCMLFRDLLCCCLSVYELYFLSFYFLQSFKSYVLLLNSIGGYF